MWLSLTSGPNRAEKGRAEQGGFSGQEVRGDLSNDPAVVAWFTTP